MVVLREKAVLDGIEIELQVREDPGGFFAACWCVPCHSGEVKYDLVPTQDEALAIARQLAEGHVQQRHKNTFPTA